MKVACIVPSAGRGKRLKRREEKTFVKINGKPIIFYTLKALEKAAFIDDIILVVSDRMVDPSLRFVKKYKFKKVSAVVVGGKMRFDSVKNGLAKVRDADIVMVHDGARPFVDTGLVGRVLSAARTSGAALPAIPVTHTLKSVGKGSFVSGTPDRKGIWEAQTPQAFRKSIIVEAYQLKKERKATDDASLAERLGYKVKVVMGSSGNIKITTPEDLEQAKALIKRRGRSV